MGKSEIAIYWFVTADISTKVLQKRFLSSPWPFPIMHILLKSLILIGFIATEMLIFISHICIVR